MGMVTAFLSQLVSKTIICHPIFTCPWEFFESAYIKTKNSFSLGFIDYSNLLL